MDTLLRKGFKVSKCQTSLKLTVSRIKLLKNKREIMVKQARGDVAQLLQMGQESSALIRCDQVSKIQNSLAAYDLIEQFCQLLIKSLSIISAQKFCPPDLKRAISSLIFAAPRCADLQELQQVRDIFAAKYGKEFVVAALELRADCGVSNQIIETLSSRPLNREARLKLAKEIAIENKIQWNPEKAETEHKRQREDVPDGHGYFVNASQGSTTADSKPKNFQYNSISEKVNVTASSSQPPPLPQNPMTNSSASAFLHHESDLPSKVKFPPLPDSPPKGAGPSVTTHQPKGWTQPEENHNSLSDKSFGGDPYARARAEGRMDYKNVNHTGSREPEENQIKDYDGPPVFGSTFGGDPYSKAKEEGRMDYRNVYDPKSHVETPEMKYEDGSIALRSPSELDQSLESDASSSEGSDSKYRDLAAAAQAADAAEAARGSVDLAMGGSRMGMNIRGRRGAHSVSDSDQQGGLSRAKNVEFMSDLRNTRKMAGDSSDSEERFYTPNAEKCKLRVVGGMRNRIETSSDSEEEPELPAVSGVLRESTDDAKVQPEEQDDADTFKCLDLSDSSGWMKAHLISRQTHSDSTFGHTSTATSLDAQDSAISAPNNRFPSVSIYHGVSPSLPQMGPAQSFDTDDDDEAALSGSPSPRFDDYYYHESEADNARADCQTKAADRPRPQGHHHHHEEIIGRRSDSVGIAKPTFATGRERQRERSATYNATHRSSRVHDSPQPQDTISTTSLAWDDDVLPPPAAPQEQIAEPGHPAIAGISAVATVKSVRTRGRQMQESRHNNYSS